MRRSLFGGLMAVSMLALAAGESVAQETGTPIFKAPYRAFTQHEFGASLSDPGEFYSVAVEGFYRYGRGPHDFGFRGGFADPNGPGDALILLGADFRTQVVSYSDAFPLDGSLTVGLGTNIGDGDDMWRLPVGISLGRRFDLEGSNATFVPYAHPVIVPVFGGPEGGDDVAFALGLGVDVRFSRDFAVRVSGGLGDIEGVGVSLTYIR
jgi:hypothetical protein